MMSQYMNVVLLAILMAAPAFPQETGARKKTVCGSQSCRSFQELLAAKDKEIADESKSDVALVCFREKEDGFFTVTWYEPDEYSWTVLMRTPDGKLDSFPLYDFADHLQNGYKQTYTPAEEQGFVSMAYYKDGVLDDTETFGGEWKAELRNGKPQQWFQMITEDKNKDRTI